MKAGIIGLSQSGKFTIYKALTGARGLSSSERTKKGDQLIGTVKVADERVDKLKEIYKPDKTVYSQIEYILPGTLADSDRGKRERENAMLTAVRTCDGLIHVVRNFQLFGGPPPTPEEDFLKLESEMILSDLMVAEKRIERLQSDGKKGREISEDELTLLQRSRDILSQDYPLRNNPEIAASPLLRGFTFLTAKPQMVIANNSDEDEELPDMSRIPGDIEVMVVRGKLEMEIAEMEPEDAEEFVSAFHVDESLLDRIIKRCLATCNLLSFFTVEGGEVRSWSVPDGTTAIDAAEFIHSDMKKGFIRAEVLAFEQLMRNGSVADAKKEGHLRLEGKTYRVQDGDIIKFRFSI
ncbi:MAG: redox-regulated ATPase YchF [Deltaproteobacteria bacterium]|nr:redox-regulated ATPase YchF [Deltaproteobacteria bacterium]MBW2077270.1 redox-regulated ATPase YchF [Deltaproteobacteria bacterium]MBW2309725.1 redox-regulated ATPase YchF [Deltaproteobacteria bacterium]RLB28465.1 MAG: redox-regulated ATPase YchF [Deltaproteobacteria bacterium]